MEKLAASEVLRKLAVGEVDLDEISEVIRSAELVIKSYRSETEGFRRNEEQLKQDFEKEKKAVDDLTQRLVALHEENQMAREVFKSEIEGKQQILGSASPLDLEVLDMAKLIHQRETVQKELCKVLGAGKPATKSFAAQRL